MLFFLSVKLQPLLQRKPLCRLLECSFNLFQNYTQSGRHFLNFGVRSWTLLWFQFFYRFYLFLERMEGREKERERDINERETLIDCLLYTPQLGSEPATQACALTWNGACDLLLCGMMRNQLSHTG